MTSMQETAIRRSDAKGFQNILQNYNITVEFSYPILGFSNLNMYVYKF